MLIGVSEGGPLCSLFATTYPERTRALVMIGTYAKRIVAPDYPWAPTPEARERFFDEIRDELGRAGGHRGAGAEPRRAIPRSASGGAPTCAWARARARRSR